MNFLDSFKAARRVSTPLIAVRTPDPAATIGLISQTTNGSPLVQWDIARGLVGLNEEGRSVASAVLDGAEPSMLTNPTEALTKFMRFPEKTVVFFFLSNDYFKEPSVIQAIWNLRDQFKLDKRTLVLLCQYAKMPPDGWIGSDVLVLDEPLPDAAQIEDIVKKIYKAANLPEPNAKTLAAAGDATCGLAAFTIEQACAMSITKNGLDMDAVWERKRQQIEQAPGLSIWRGGEKFKDVGGCANIKTFLSRVLKGEAKPRAIVFIDEIEKALAGASGDLSGTSQEMLGTLLSFMQDKAATGLLFIGPPGAAKSAMAKASGNEAGIPTISFDLSGMKGSLVGESGANIRAALKLVEAVAQGRALFVATCNSIGALPPELRRRFSFGTFFFDLPNAEERTIIWKIYFDKYPKVKDRELPNDSGWTGAEIKQCVDLAWRLGCTLKDASAYIVPVSKSAAEQINTLRRMADGRFISASNPGLYLSTSTTMPQSSIDTVRRLEVAQ